MAWYNLTMLQKEYRLKKRSAFSATYKTGTVFHSGGITVFCGRLKSQEQTETITKIGFVVSKKIHKRAVKRNRIKRLMREAVRIYIKENKVQFNPKYLSLVFTASTKLLDKDYKYINNNINEIMRHIKND